MQVKDEYGSSGEPREMDWPFLIKDLMGNSSCPSSKVDLRGLCISVALIVFGILFACFGYRCLRAIGFITGAVIGFGFLLLIKKLNFYDPLDIGIAIGVSIVVAALCTTLPIAAGLVSLFSGAILSQVTMSICIATLPNYEIEKTIVYLAIAIGAVLFLIFSFCCMKIATILTTSIVGTVMIMSAIDYLLHDLDTVKWMINMERNPSPPPCWGGILLFLSPIIITVSVMMQSFITAWRFNYSLRKKHRIQMQQQKQAAASSSKRHQNQHIKEPQSAVNGVEAFGAYNGEARPQRFRYLYQVRTSKGDIISQPYIAALQKRIKPNFSCSFGKKGRCYTRNDFENEQHIERLTSAKRISSIECISEISNDHCENSTKTTSSMNSLDYCDEVKVIRNSNNRK